MTDPNYIADEKTDVYALGVMMFEVITRMHPYIHQKNYKTQKEFVMMLRNSAMVRPPIVSTYTVVVQVLFDLATRMVSHRPKNRPTCQEIFDYVDNDEAFRELREKLGESTQEIVIQPMPMTIT